MDAADPVPYETISGGDRTHRVTASGIHVNFAGPNTTINTNFGRIIATQANPRSWQFALKVTY